MTDPRFSRSAATTLPHSQARVESSFLSQVYGWMAAGLGLTGLVAWYVSQNPTLVGAIAGNQLIFFGLFIVQLGLVVVLSGLLERLSVLAAMGIFLAYSALTGVTLSMIFLVYTQASIASTFLVTAGTFGAVSFYGMTTKRDLSGLGSVLFMALIGLILASVVNWFLKNSALYWIITYAGILIFVGLTAYDTQKLLAVHRSGRATGAAGQKLAVYGALRLYLDFINLFLLLLRVLGRRR